MRDIANVDRNGASLKGLATAAESIGFTIRPVRASLDRLAQQNLPAIAHWEGKYYIVVYEVTKDRVIVDDRRIGQRNLTLLYSSLRAKIGVFNVRVISKVVFNPVASIV